MKNFSFLREMFYPLIIIFFMTSLICTDLNNDPENIDVEEINYAESYEEEFTEEKLIFFIDKLNFQYPEIILAQTILETGYYKSEVFCINNNLFGMRQPFSRVNLSGGTKNGHSYYNNWVESIIDYGFWYSTYAYKCTSKEEFLDLLNKTYAEDENYKVKLIEIVKTQNLEEKFKKNELLP
jgi:uncharacterized FlgJ-related protein